MPSKLSYAQRKSGFEAQLEARRIILSKLQQASTQDEFDKAKQEFSVLPQFTVSNLRPDDASRFYGQYNKLTKSIDDCIKTKQFVAINNPNNDKALKDAISQSLSAVNEALTIANEKIKALSAKGDEKGILAANAAVQVCTQLIAARDQYANLTLTKKQFEAEAKRILDENQPDMKQAAEHRGFKQILVDLASVFLTLFVGYAIAAAIKRSFTIFPVNTDTQNKLLNIGKAIDTLPEIDAAALTA